jgi:hypothetical protein
MLFLVLVAAAAAAQPNAAWESYECESGPTIRLALNDARPAEKGWLETPGGIVELTRHEGEGKTVLRGGGYMVVAPNWADILYAPPGKEKAAYSCRIANAASPPGKPIPE